MRGQWCIYGMGVLGYWTCPSEPKKKKNIKKIYLFLFESNFAGGLVAECRPFTENILSQLMKLDIKDNRQLNYVIENL